MGEVGESSTPRKREFGYTYRPEGRRKIASRARKRVSPFSNSKKTEPGLLQKVKDVAPRVIAAGALVGSAGFAAEKTIDAFSGSGQDSKPATQNTLVLPEDPQNQIENKIVPSEPVFDQIFGNLEDKEKVEAMNTMIDMEKVIRENPSYKEMVGVVAKNEAIIDEIAPQFGIPPDEMKGQILIENGGGEDLASSAGAVGIAQFMPATAEALGLIDPETGVDKRTDPTESIKTMAQYLASLKAKFGNDLGFAVQAYHTGEGNIYGMLEAYFLDTQGLDYGNPATTLNDAVAWNAMQNYSDLISNGKLSVHRFLNNPAVKKFIEDNKLTDETELYTYKTAAAVGLFAQEKLVGNAAKWAELVR